MQLRHGFPEKGDVQRICMRCIIFTTVFLIADTAYAQNTYCTLIYNGKSGNRNSLFSITGASVRRKKGGSPNKYRQDWSFYVTPEQWNRFCTLSLLSMATQENPTFHLDSRQKSSLHYFNEQLLSKVKKTYHNASMVQNQIIKKPKNLSISSVIFNHR